MAIRFPTMATEQSDVATIADFFSIPPTGKTMERLTGLSSSSLSRIVAGETRRSNRFEHVAVVAQYVREMHDLMIEMSKGQTEARGDTAAWLSTAELDTRRGRMFAGDVLADPDLAREALASLRQLTW